MVFHVGPSLATWERPWQRGSVRLLTHKARVEMGGHQLSLPYRQLSLAGKEFLSSFVLLYTRSLKLMHVRGRRGLGDE